jgi:hypothetical protein
VAIGQQREVCRLFIAPCTIHDACASLQTVQEESAVTEPLFRPHEINVNLVTTLSTSNIISSWGILEK